MCTIVREKSKIGKEVGEQKALKNPLHFNSHDKQNAEGLGNLILTVFYDSYRGFEC